MSSKVRFLKAAPIGDTDPNVLPVKAVGPAIGYFAHVFGFQLVSRDGKRAVLRRDDATIGLEENDADPEQASVYFGVEGVEALRAELEAKGIEPTPLRVDTYGENRYRVFFAKEPYGVCFCFGEPT